MANGFAAGGFAEGLASGVDTASRIGARNRTLSLREDALGLKRQALEQKQTEALRDAATADLETIQGVIDTAAQERGPEAALRIIEKPEFQKLLGGVTARLDAAGGGPDFGQTLESLRIRAQTGPACCWNGGTIPTRC